MWTKSPRYFSGVVTAIVTWLMLAAAICAWWIVCKRDNRGRDSRAVVMVEEDGGGEKSVEEIDLTDRQDRGYRYTW